MAKCLGIEIQCNFETGPLARVIDNHLQISPVYFLHTLVLHFSFVSAHVEQRPPDGENAADKAFANRTIVTFQQSPQLRPSLIHLGCFDTCPVAIPFETLAGILWSVN